MKRLINVSNRLPITIGKTIRKSAGGLVTAMEGISRDFDLRWVGWAGGAITDLRRRQEIGRKIEAEYRYYPIFLSKKEIAGYYNGFANASLWPLLHYMATYSRYDKSWFDDYHKVNSYFAEKTLELARPNDMVWVHDYHLLLLPALLRKARPGLKIGFFLHTPFPSYELFRCHPNRDELLRGMLGADLIGFHTYGYLRHFRSTALRVLGLESQMDHISHGNRKTMLGVYPIGINAAKFQHELQSQNFHNRLARYRKVYKDQKIILSVERLDYTKGIPRRLDAIEIFLNRYGPCDDLVFIFICVPSRGEVQAYKDLSKTVELKISKINGKFSTIMNIPIHFMHKSVNFSELCALYALADVALVTPLMDGMNLVAKEYVACRKDKSGVLILSEFAGAAQELFNALVVNPYDVNQVAEALQLALDLPENEKRDLLAPMRESVMKNDAAFWARSFLSSLTHITRKDLTLIATLKLSLPAFKPFWRSRRIAFFLDYDGTLCGFHDKPSDAYPHEDIKKLFAMLSALKNLDVYLISGRKRENMDQWFSGYHFMLVAEHGYFYKCPEDSAWKMMNSTADLSWMPAVTNIFKDFSASTPGSAVEVKTASVVWHYRESDPEFGAWKAGELAGELHEMLSNQPVAIYRGKKIVEVSSLQLNKGLVMEHFIKLHHYDAVLCAGDDETDESMFQLEHENLISVKVGSEETRADFKVIDPATFRDFLKKALKKISRRKA